MVSKNKEIKRRTCVNKETFIIVQGKFCNININNYSRYTEENLDPPTPVMFTSMHRLNLFFNIVLHVIRRLGGRKTKHSSEGKGSW